MENVPRDLFHNGCGRRVTVDSSAARLSGSLESHSGPLGHFVSDASKKRVERLETEQEGNRSSQVDSEWSTGAPSGSGVTSRFSVEHWHFAQSDVEVAEWMVDSTLGSSTPSRCGLDSSSRSEIVAIFSVVVDIPQFRSLCLTVCLRVTPVRNQLLQRAHTRCHQPRQN